MNQRPPFVDSDENFRLIIRSINRVAGYDVRGPSKYRGKKTAKGLQNVTSKLRKVGKSVKGFQKRPRNGIKIIMVFRVIIVRLRSVQKAHSFKTPSYSSITNSVMALDRREDISIRAVGNGHLPDSTIDLAITEGLDISLFHSVRSLASTIKRLPRTV
jgi:hypothetical protein